MQLIAGFVEAGIIWEWFVKRVVQEPAIVACCRTGLPLHTLRQGPGVRDWQVWNLFLRQAYI